MPKPKDEETPGATPSPGQVNSKPDKPEKPEREKRSLYARHVAAWRPKDFKDVLELALERLTQDKGKLVEVSYSTVAAASSVASPVPDIHYSAIIWYELPKGAKPPEGEVPTP